MVKNKINCENYKWHDPIYSPRVTSNSLCLHLEQQKNKFFESCFVKNFYNNCIYFYDIKLHKQQMKITKIERVKFIYKTLKNLLRRRNG